MSSVVPAAEVEPGPGRQEVEAGLRQLGAAFARQHDVEPFAQAVQMQHVGGGVGQLRLAQASATPQSLDCCCFDRSTLSTSRTRSFRPWRSV